MVPLPHSDVFPFSLYMGTHANIMNITLTSLVTRCIGNLLSLLDDDKFYPFVKLSDSLYVLEKH